MSKRWAAILLAVVFIAAVVALTIVFREALQERVVQPLVEAWNNLRNSYRKMSPEIIWAAFMAVAYFFTILTMPRQQSAITALFASREKINHVLFAEVKPDQEPDGRLSFWVQEVGRLYRDRMQTRLSVLELKRLVLETIAHRESFSSMHEAEAWLEENKRGVPPEVMGLLHVRRLVRQEKGCNPLAQLWMRLQIGQREAEAPVEIAPSQKIAIILKYLEQLKEVEHDRRNI